MIEVQTSSSGNGDSVNDNNDTDYSSIISSHIDSLSPSLRHLSLTIHDNPEVRNKEFIAHEAITKFIRAQSAVGQKWEVTPSAYGIGTAFVAVLDSGREGAAVSFNAEYGKFSCSTTGI
jgi:metal-dependent amidase/aminoacylase/carboxypeptidase family protein